MVRSSEIRHILSHELTITDCVPIPFQVNGIFSSYLLSTAGSVNVGLAVGLSLGLLFLICIFGAIGGFVFYCSRKRRPPQTGVAATTPDNVVAKTENTPAASPTPPPYPPRSSPTIYPTQASPVASYPPQPDAQLRVVLPSYDAATSYYTTGVCVYIIASFPGSYIAHGVGIIATRQLWLVIFMCEKYTNDCAVGMS